MYIKHVKPMKRAHNKKRSVYRGEKFVRKKSAARIMHIILTIRFDLFALFLIVILLVHIVKNYKRHGSKADRRRRKQNPQNFLNAAPV